MLPLPKELQFRALFPFSVVAGESWSRHSQELGGFKIPSLRFAPGLFLSVRPAASASEEFSVFFSKIEKNAARVPLQPPAFTRQLARQTSPPKYSPASRHGVLHGTVLVPRCCRVTQRAPPFSPRQSPCLPSLQAFLLWVRTNNQGVISAFETFSCVVVVPFIHTCVQIPICLVARPFGREFCQPAHLCALQGQNCLCLYHCLHCRPGGSQALQVCALFGCVQNASCVRWCVCVTFQIKTALLKCEHSPLLMGDLGAGGWGHFSERLMHTCMYVFHFLADLC